MVVDDMSLRIVRNLFQLYLIRANNILHNQVHICKANVKYKVSFYAFANVNGETVRLC